MASNADKKAQNKILALKTPMVKIQIGGKILIHNKER